MRFHSSMGLGKTLQSIGLILSNPPVGRDGVKTYPYKIPRRKEFVPPRCTIIVSPVSVMSNWMMGKHAHFGYFHDLMIDFSLTILVFSVSQCFCTEIDKFVHKKKKNILKVEIYQGPRRIEVLRKLHEGKLDILICSYQTLASDFKKYKNVQDEKAELQISSNENRKQEALSNNNDPAIFEHNFHRIILDEAHMIRNAKTLYFQSVKSLTAMHKLCLTGTPFVNHPRDIHSFLDFLDVAPCNNIDTFNHFIIQQIEERKEVGLASLRVLMGAIAIRRTKKEVDGAIQLPEKNVHIRKIPFPESCQHKQISHMLYHTCRTAYLALSNSGSSKFGGKAFMLLGMVLRVRQSCCDASLVPAEVLEEVSSLWKNFRDVDVEDLSNEEGMQLFENLLGALATAKEKIEFAKRESITQEDGIDDLVPTSQKSKRKQSTFGRSPKVQALMDAITEMKPDEKGVIFSQWTQFLDM